MLPSHFKNLLLFALLICNLIGRTQEISLAGQWRFAIDKEGKGVEEKWFSRELQDVIQLPGSMTQNGKGDDVTLYTKWVGSIYDSSYFFRPSLAKYRQPNNLKIPFWLTPVKHYVGFAWYQKDVVIPADWNQKRITLFLERAHIETKVWVDEIEVGTQNSLVAPHEYVLTNILSPGKHTITIRIDNSIKERNVGPDSHSVSDHTQGDWNGIVGKISLRATPVVYIEYVQVYPDIKKMKAGIEVSVVNSTKDTVTGKLMLEANSVNSKIAHKDLDVGVDFILPPGDTLRSPIPFPPLPEKMLLWDEFNPALYELAVALQTDRGTDTKIIRFGMREIKVAANKILLNGRTIHLRGDVNNCEFPLTGYAPMDIDSWKRVFTIAKSHGLNHMRFHSWCPPEAAFAAADEVGFYLQPEGPTWPNHGTSLGDGRFIDNYLYQETDRILKAYGSHPSFCMLAAGNEPAGRNQAKYLGEYVKHYQAKDNRRLYTGASVAMSWPLYPESDYMIKSGPRGLNYDKLRPESLSDYRAVVEAFTVPYITHEMGQWCVFPDFKEIKKYTGINRAKNFELFQEDLKDHGMENHAEDFFLASGKLQALCYKMEIEKSLRTKNSAGFQLLGLQDFPGQGTALVGVLNALWEEKGYLKANEWNRFCSATVPLTRMAKFTFSNSELFEASVEVYHYGPSDLNNALVEWSVKNEVGKIIEKGKLPAITIKTGGNTEIGKIKFGLSSIKKASQLKLEVKVSTTSFANDWNFWVYPNQLPTVNTHVYYTDTLDEKAEGVLNKGGKVFLNAAGKVIKGKEVVQYFTPVFWNTSWFKMRPPHTLGIFLNPKHPAFAEFPTSFHSDLQWWEIVNKAQVMHLEDFPKGFQPLVQSIDTWFMNRKLGLIIEARVGNGKLMVSSADLLSDTADRVAARQLFYSLQRYMESDQFNPKDKVDLKLVKDLFITRSREVWDSFSKANPDELKPQTQKN